MSEAVLAVEKCVSPIEQGDESFASAVFLILPR